MGRQIQTTRHIVWGICDILPLSLRRLKSCLFTPTIFDWRLSCIAAPDSIRTNLDGVLVFLDIIFSFLSRYRLFDGFFASFHVRIIRFSSIPLSPDHTVSKWLLEDVISWRVFRIENNIEAYFREITNAIKFIKFIKYVTSNNDFPLSVYIPPVSPIWWIDELLVNFSANY